MVRFLRSLSRPALIRRFVTSVREEGIRVALAKARIVIGMQLRGEGRSALDGAAGNDTSASGAAIFGTSEFHLNGIWQQLAEGEAFHVNPPSPETPPFVAIIGDLNLPQCRKYRVEQLAAFWRNQGIACDYAHYQDLPRVMRLLARATRVIEYRLQSTPMTEMIRYEARRLQLPILYDIDDPLFSITAYETYGNMAALAPAFKKHFLSEAPKYLSMMNGADRLSVSTPGLAEHARLLTARPVHIRRNFADTETLENGKNAMRKRHRNDAVFSVVFASGSQGHEVDFKLILPQLAAFFAQTKTARLLLVGHFDVAHLPDAIAARSEIVPFVTYDKYLATLARADCAIMPLADDIFNRCKSAVRVIDASSVGVPSIVGNVGDLQNVVLHEKTGLVAQTPQDWYDALVRMQTDRTATARMGDAARRDLETRWSAQNADYIIDPAMMDWVRA